MNFQLNILHRMVLESINVKEKTISEIVELTRIEKDIINKILNQLIVKNILTLSGEFYKVNPNLNQLIKEELNDQHNLISEVNEIISSCLRKRVSNNSANSFKLKKVNMSPREEKIFDGLLYNIESFLDSLNKTDQVADQKIIFWGGGNYEDIKNTILNY